jgi:hypothetical protein
VQWIKRVLLDGASFLDKFDLMVEKEAYESGTQYNKGLIYSNEYYKL